MQLTSRQEKIVHIVKEEGPITAQELADNLNLSRAALRTDLSLLSMMGFLHAKPRVGYEYIGDGGLLWLQDLWTQTRVQAIQAVPIVVRDTLSIYDVAITLFMEDVDSIFVVDEKGSLKGVVSSRELIKVMLGEGDLQSIPVSVAMERLDVSRALRRDSSLSRAINVLQEKGRETVPVLEGEKPVGQVSRRDVLQYLVERVRGEDTT